MLAAQLSCLFCNHSLWTVQLEKAFKEWKSFATVTQENLAGALEPLHRFEEIMDQFQPECRFCKGMPIICLLGRTSAGKSTVMNLMLGKKPVLTKSNLGTIQIEFMGDQVSAVGSGIHSQTMFPVIHVYQKSLLIDFPGFMENRAGQLEVVQHFLLHKLTQNRLFKLVFCKDIRVERDLAFINLLNQDFVTSKNSLVVMTRCDKRHKVDWRTYSEGKMNKPIPIVMMPVAEKNVSYRSFEKSLQRTLLDTFFSDRLIHLPISPEVYQFQGQALDFMREKIDIAFSAVLETGFRSIVIEPYDVSYLREVLQGQYTLSQAIYVLQETLIAPQGIMKDLERDWNLLAALSKAPIRQNWGQWTPSSNSLMVDFHHKLNTFSPPSYPPFTSDLQTNLMQWNDLVHTHYLEHVSFRARAFILAEKGAAGNFTAFHELVRLADYRHEIYEKLLSVWKPLEGAFMAELEKEDSGDENAGFFDSMRMKDSRFVLAEILRFSSQNHRDLAQAFKVVARQLTGVALADGSIAMGAWGVKVAGAIATGSAVEGSLANLAYLTSNIFAVTASAAVGAFAYHFYLTNRQLQKIRAVGFDFSFLQVESCIWQDIRQAASEQNVKKIRNAFHTYEKEFRLLISSTEKGVVKAKRKLHQARARGVDIGNWGRLIDNVEKMSKQIFLEMKARDNSVAGCHFHEHEWMERSFLSFKWVFPQSCCTLFLSKLDLECIHCQFLCHSGESCRLVALQLPCKSYIEGQSLSPKAKPSAKLKVMTDFVSEMESEAGHVNANQELISLGMYCGMIYDDDLVADDEIFIKEEGEIKYFLLFSGTTAYVIIRGTVMLSISNWITNASALQKKFFKDCLAHGGYSQIAESIYPTVWSRIEAREEIKEVVFAGHSLGGAIAHTLNGKSLVENKPIPSRSVGFGAPMVFDKATYELLLSEKKNDRFLTFVNQLDLVPGIMQNITSALKDKAQLNIQGDLGELAAAAIGIISNKVTRAYHPVGTYVFYEPGALWKTIDSNLILSRLLQNKAVQENVKFHDMATYRLLLPSFLDQEEREQLLSSPTRVAAPAIE
ncbi:Lipase-like pad4 [Kappamyces sp. JEL0829]|nr:Lipase-like pad4 [Kappamyces sp. JEL0829]